MFVLSDVYVFEFHTVTCDPNFDRWNSSLE
ncbi:hypothetical protein LSH36_219g01040 [Paralvinella palmiformis]|uniref:Uncharacterized protein n=1 Tax=Paralvinella palmiformis TaxID=53620 RepID=A0AAD9JNW7_9ANNE|nr:hypothetical protein LSH36_219g01040 [Paralvinella palmiformis]